MIFSLLRLCLFTATATSLSARELKTVAELTSTAASATEGAVIQLAAGTFQLTEPLELKGGVTLKGAGTDKTTLTHAESWKANPATLPDSETDHEKFDRTGYLIHCGKEAKHRSK